MNAASAKMDGMIPFTQAGDMAESSEPEAKWRIGKHLRDLLAEREKKRGFLIVFEGPDGSGKSTQRKLFKDWLRTEGHAVVTTKWTSSPLLQPLIKARKKAHSFSPEEFSLLHAADFRHRLDTIVLPALWEGKIVVSDRYMFTALARDAARGLTLDWLLRVYEPLLWPDLVFYFSVSPETAGKRIAATRAPRYYEAGQDITDVADPLESYQRFIRRVIREYEALAVIFQFVTVDAEQSIYDQHRSLRKLFEQRKLLPWAEWNQDAILEWLGRNPRVREAPRGF